MANTLTGLIPEIEDAVDVVSRELVGFIPAVTRNSNAERAAVGQVVSYPVVPAATTGDVTPGATPPNDGDQVIGKDSLTITKSKYSPIRWNGEETKGLGSAGQRLNIILRDQIAQSIRALVNLVEADIFAAAYVAASRAVGSAGTAPFASAGDLSDSANVLRILEENGQTSDLQLVLGAAAMANIRGKQSVLFKVNEAGTDQLLRQGVLGLLQGMQVHNSGAIRQITKGTGTGYLVNDASGVAMGGTDVTVDTGTGTILAGDVVSFAADTANKYVVGATLNAGEFSLNQPGARVAIPDNNAITVGSSYTPNLAFARSAIHLVTRAPALPVIGGRATDMADDRYTAVDPISGLAFEISLYRQYKQVKLEVALAWGVKAAKSEGIATLMG